MQDHFEAGFFTDPTVCTSAAKLAKSRAKSGTRYRMKVSRGREILTTTPAILAHRLGGSAREIEIDGGVITHGQGIVPVELDGAIQSRWVIGEFEAA